MRIKNFLERNKSIFVIGVILGIVFVAIILFYVIKPHEETELSNVKTADQQFYKVAYENLDEENSGNNLEETGDENQPQEEKTPEMTTDEKYGILQIDYIDSGFSPRITRAALGQAVSWTNKTDKTIYFRQIKKSYPELEELIEIKPGESFNIRMTVLGIWSYEESESRNFGSIDVKEQDKMPVVEKVQSNTPESENVTE